MRQRRAPIEIAPPVERAFLIAVDTGNDPGWPAEDSLEELASLARTAGAEIVGAEWQQRRHADPDTYIGAGKARELLAAKAETGLRSSLLTMNFRQHSSAALKRSLR